MRKVFVLLGGLGLCVWGSWLAGQALYAWFGFDGAQAGMGTWWRYALHWHDAVLQPHRMAVVGSGTLGLMPVGVAVGLWGIGYWKKRPPSLHGDARFATLAELRQAGLCQSGTAGVLLGRVGKQYLRDHGQRFVLLAAPTRSGKGVGVVIPVLLDYAHSVVVLDIKQENHHITSGYRQALGQSVYVFNPFAASGQSHRWNPLRYIASTSAQRVQDLRAMAHMLYPDGDNTGNHAFFIEHARNVFVALCLYLFESYALQQQCAPERAQYPTMGALYRLAMGQGQDTRQYFVHLMEEDHLSERCQQAFAGFVSQAPETLAGIMGTFQAAIMAWGDPILDAATSGDDFLLTDVRKRPMSIYLCVTPNQLQQAARVFNLFFAQLVHENTKVLPSQDTSLRYQCLLLMDEFTTLGAVDILAHSVGYMAGYNLRLLPVIQSMAQLESTYGKERARNFATNHATHILFAPREQEDAQTYSEMLGYTTVQRKQTTHGKEKSHTQVLERRALLLPQELKAMGAEQEIIFMEGLAHPARVQKIRYYQERWFKGKLLPATKVPTLPLRKQI